MPSKRKKWFQPPRQRSLSDSIIGGQTLADRTKESSQTAAALSSAHTNRASARPSMQIPFWVAVVIIAVVGFTVYFSGLSNDFVLDDVRQIVNNPSIQSGINWGQFFSGSTAYSGQIDGNLIGPYYRPLMVVSYAFIYSAFGSGPTAFHLIQLLLSILVAVVLYLFFRYSFEPLSALALSLIFLIHPINGQSVFLYCLTARTAIHVIRSFGLMASSPIFLREKSSSSRGLLIFVPNR